MNPLVDKYIRYIDTVRRYSDKTCDNYVEVLEEFVGYSLEDPDDAAALPASITPTSIRNYEVHLLEERKLGSRTVNLHLSVLSGFCRFLMLEGLLKSNPVRLVTRPKAEKRLPVFYRDDSMDEYYADTDYAVSTDSLDLLRSICSSGSGDTIARELYERRLRRMIVSLLHSCGIRRAELASLDVQSVDFGRNMLKVRGKGDKMREVPLVETVVEELKLYLEAADIYFSAFPADLFEVVSAGGAGGPAAGAPLLRTPSGRRLYPVFIDRAVKRELGGVSGITGRKSPHVLRHTIATELLNDGSDINSIKELLGHSSLAATQVYTHNSIEKLRAVYDRAHPRAKDPSSSD